MSILQKLSDNKIGIGLAVVHWIIIALAYGSIRFFDALPNSLSIFEIFGMLLLIVDLPAIIPAAFLWLPIFIFDKNAKNLFYGIAVTSFFTITYQWLFIGKAVHNTFSAEAAKPISLSLND